MENLRINALALHFGIDADNLQISTYDDYIVTFGDQEYLVVTDDEGDDLWENDLNNYIDECILPELPEMYRNYFDHASWKNDARYDGRAHLLATYDGCEDEITVHQYKISEGNDIYSDKLLDEHFLEGKETFYIYRRN